MEPILRHPPNAGLFQRVYDIVESIPSGKVMTYGQIACMLGNVRLSRRVGQALFSVPAGRKLPCHRVVKAGGVLPPADLFPAGQRALLEAEGVPFLADGRVDLSHCGV